MKPLEVEILVAEVGYEADDDQLFHILYDGTVVDERGFSVLGGDADAIGDRLRERFSEGMGRDDALRAAVAALAGPDRTLKATELEAALLARSNGRRAFQRVEPDELASLLGA